VAGQPLVLVFRGSRPFRPVDARRVQPIVSQLLPRSVVRAVAGRLEIVAFTEPTPAILSALAGRLGAELVSVERVGEPEGDLEGLLSLYMSLLGSSRFWHAHTVGEAIWRRVGPMGRQLAHLAGVYAKAQEGQLLPACKLLSKLLNSNDGERLPADMPCLLEELVKVYETSYGNVRRCISLPRLSKLLGLEGGGTAQTEGSRPASPPS
jgi:hypothetical protein